MRYFVYGYYGFGNFGDNLMLSAIVHQISARDPAARFTVKCRAPIDGLGSAVEFLTAETILELPEPAWRRGLNYLGALFRALPGHDWLIIGGGALFLDKGMMNKSLVLLWCLAVRARLMGLRIAIVGVSCDLLANPATLWLTRSIFRRADVVTVRDQFSYDYARYFGCRQVRFCADLAFASPLLTADSAAAVETGRVSRRQAAGKPRIGICLVDYFAVYEPDAKRRQVFINRVTASLLKHAAAAEYVYVSLQEGQGLGDERVYATLAKTVAFAEYRSVRSLGEALELCGDLDGMLTMRYHFGLLGAAFGIPVAALCHELKLLSVALMPGVTAVSLSQLVADASADPIGELLLAPAPMTSQADVDRMKREAIANFDWLP